MNKVDIVCITLVHPSDFNYLSILYRSLLNQERKFYWLVFIDGNEYPPFDIKLPHKLFMVGHIESKSARRVPFLLGIAIKYAINKLKSDSVFILDSDVYLPSNYITSCIESGYDVTHGLFYEIDGYKPRLMVTRYGKLGLSGAALMVKSEVIKDIGFYPSLGWDTVLFTLASIKGYKVGVNEGTYFVHLKPQRNWRRYILFGRAHAKMGFNFLYLLGKSLNLGLINGIPFLVGVLYGYLRPVSVPKKVYEYYRVYSRYLIKLYMYRIRSASL